MKKKCRLTYTNPTENDVSIGFSVAVPHLWRAGAFARLVILRLAYSTCRNNSDAEEYIPSVGQQLELTSSAL